MRNHMANGLTQDQTVPSVVLRTGRAMCGRGHGPGLGLAMAAIMLLAGLIAAVPARAQQANPPAYDPRQTEKRFEDVQSGQGQTARSRLPMPRVSRAEGPADTKPLFVLRRVTVTGATTIPRDRLVTAYQPYVGKKVSQADLNAMATAVGEVYRAAGFHLSRAVIPPQDIQDGTILLNV